jgi:alcohol dehydrogenase YqhD (iron-dependent ADH family)
VTDADESAAIEKGIVAMESFFHSLGMPTKLADHKISPADAAKRVSERFTQRNAKNGENGEILPADAGKILLSA